MQNFTITQPSIAAAHGSAEYRALALCGTSGEMTDAGAFVGTDR